MPLDINVSKPSPSTSQWMFKLRRVGKQSKISLRPRRCYISGKQLWMKRCIVVTSLVTGPGEPLLEDFWCDTKEFFLDEIRG
jgi:hypothetical protein